VLAQSARRWRSCETQNPADSLIGPHRERQAAVLLINGPIRRVRCGERNEVPRSRADPRRRLYGRVLRHEGRHRRRASKGYAPAKIPPASAACDVGSNWSPTRNDPPGGAARHRGAAQGRADRRANIAAAAIVPEPRVGGIWWPEPRHMLPRSRARRAAHGSDPSKGHPRSPTRRTW